MWQLTFMSPLETLNNIAMAFDEEDIVSISWQEIPKSIEWEVRVIFAYEPESAYWQGYLNKYCRVMGLATPEVWVVPVEEKNWLHENAKLFAPFTVGRFYVHNREYNGDVPEGKTAMVVAASTAFGSGHHETTQGCVMALERLIQSPYTKKPYHILDMGTGSGILAIAAAKIWENAQITAIDCDPEAVRVCTQNTQINGVSETVEVLESDHVRLGNVRCYDVIVANILCQPLKEMAPQVFQSMCRGGYIILSGILNEQAKQICETYIPLGFTLCEHTKKGEWSTLMLSKT